MLYDDDDDEEDDDVGVCTSAGPVEQHLFRVI